MTGSGIQIGREEEMHFYCRRRRIWSTSYRAGKWKP